MSIRRFVVLLSVFAACSLFQPAASAQGTDSRFRLAVTADVFRYERANYAALRDLPGSEQHVETFAFGLLAPRLGLELGGLVTDEVALGVTGALLYTDPGEGDYFQWLVLPWLEFAFLPGSSLRPYVRASMGGTGSKLSASNTSTTAAQFAIGGTFGVHLFASGDVSIDPFLNVLYRVGTQAQTTSSAGSESSRGLDGVEVSLGLSLSVWVGGHGGAVAETPASPGSDAPVPQVSPRTAGFRAEGGAMELDIVVPGIAVARLRSRPDANGRDVQLAMLRYARARPLPRCETAILRSERGEVGVPVVVTSRTIRGEAREALTITATAEQLDVLAARGGSLELCGSAITFDVGARAALVTYLARFRAAAAQHGTAAPAEPAPAEPEQAAPDELAPAEPEQAASAPAESPADAPAH